MKNNNKKFPIAKREDVRNQKLQKRATQLKSKFGDEYKVEVKDNKIMVDNGIDKWVVN